MSSRRKAAATTPDHETVQCFCGGTDFDYSFARFPMAHVSRCRACGLEHRAVLKVEPPKPAKAAPQNSPVGYPPLWF